MSPAQSKPNSIPAAADPQATPRRYLPWVLRQTIIGLGLLAALVTGGAWLTYYGIDQEAQAGQQAGASDSDQK